MLMQIMQLLTCLKLNKKYQVKQAKIATTTKIERMLPLKYLNNFSKILEMPLIICGINPNLNWSRNWVIVASNADEVATFSITDTKLYVLVLTLSTKDNASLLTVEIKDYNVLINFLDQTVRNDLITYESICKITTCQGDDYTTGCLQDYNYFKNYYKMIVIDLVNKKHLMLIQKQYKKLILLEIYLEKQKYFSLVKKR